MPQIPIKLELGDLRPFEWTCPFCCRDTTITRKDISESRHQLKIETSEGHRLALSRFIICPNPNCKKLMLSFILLDSKKLLEKSSLSIEWEDGALLYEWNLIPESLAKPFPNYIPEVILTDYLEACLIQNKSPKASATLSRRCLQGILRDYWEVKPETLSKEIEQIKDKVEPSIWNAIDAVRKIGNIGAHMEKDINVIVDVEPNEAYLLIELIEILLKEWYVAREERNNRISKITAIATSKEQERKSNRTYAKRRKGAGKTKLEE
jgi:Domain of unknown function (DUF4145)